MSYRFFTFGFDPELGNFDTTELDEFLEKTKAISSCTEQFFMYENRPYWTIIVKYVPQNFTKKQMPKSQNSTSETSTKDAYKHVLREEDQTLFKKLKDWRYEEAKKRGQPIYMISDNMKLAKIERNRPKTLENLKELQIGSQAIEKWGNDILGMVQAWELSISTKTTQTPEKKEEKQVEQQTPEKKQKTPKEKQVKQETPEKKEEKQIEQQTSEKKEEKNPIKS